MANNLSDTYELTKKFRISAKKQEDLENNVKDWRNIKSSDHNNQDPYVSFKEGTPFFNVYGMFYFRVNGIKYKNNYLNFENYDLENEKYELKNTEKFLEIHFIRDKNLHLAPIFLLPKKRINDIHFVIFSSIATDANYPYVEVKSLLSNKGHYCEAFFPIIYQKQETADKMEHIRDILYAFFYYYGIKIIIQKAKYIIKDENLKERDAILTVGISPFLRFPGLLKSVTQDKENAYFIHYASTKLNDEDKKYIEDHLKKSIPGINNKVKSYKKINEEELSNENETNKDMAISSVLIFDSKRRKMKTIGFSNLHFFDIACRRLKIACDLFKIFKYTISDDKFTKSYEFPASNVISIVDAGQRNSIMDVSNCISKSFYYDSNPGSSLCSYRTINDKHYLFFVFRTADKNNNLLNANALAVSLRISDIIIIPVSFPPFNFIECFEFAYTRMELFTAEKSQNYSLDKHSKKKIFLQFSCSTKKNEAMYFTRIFQKTLDTLGLRKSFELYYFIGYEDITKLLNIDVNKADDHPIENETPRARTNTRMTNRVRNTVLDNNEPVPNNNQNNDDDDDEDDNRRRRRRNVRRNRPNRTPRRVRNNTSDEEEEPVPNNNQDNNNDDDDDEDNNRGKRRRNVRRSRPNRTPRREQNNTSDDDEEPVPNDNQDNNNDDDNQDDNNDDEDEDNNRGRRRRRNVRRNRPNRASHRVRNNSSDDDEESVPNNNQDNNNDDEDEDNNRGRRNERGNRPNRMPRREQNNTSDDDDDDRVPHSNDDEEKRDLKFFINSITAFSVVNDYRDYIDMNIFFPSEKDRNSLEFNTF